MNSLSRSHGQVKPPRYRGGFTLVELIVVLILIGVMAVGAATSTQGSATLGLRDQTISLLRYAQKQAVAARRDVYLQLHTEDDLSTLYLCYGDAECDGDEAEQVREFANNAVAKLTYPVGIYLTHLSSAGFHFDSRGQFYAGGTEPGNAPAFGLSGVDLPDIHIEGSGYVH